MANCDVCESISSVPCNKIVDWSYLSDITSCIRKNDGNSLSIPSGSEYPTRSWITSNIPAAVTNSSDYTQNVDGVLLSGSGDLVRVCEITAYCTSFESFEITNPGTGSGTCGGGPGPDPGGCTYQYRASADITSISNINKCGGDGSVEVTVERKCTTATTWENCSSCSVTWSGGATWTSISSTSGRKQTITASKNETSSSRSASYSWTAKNPDGGTISSGSVSVSQLAGCPCSSVSWPSTSTLSWDYNDTTPKTLSVGVTCGTVSLSNTTGDFTASYSSGTLTITPKGENDGTTEKTGTVTLKFNDGCSDCSTFSVSMSQKVNPCSDSNFSSDSSLDQSFGCNDTTEHLLFTVSHSCGKVSGTTSNPDWTEVRVDNENGPNTNIYWRATTANATSEVRNGTVNIYIATDGSYVQWRTVNVHQNVCEATCSCTSVTWPSDAVWAYNEVNEKTLSIEFTCGSVSMASVTGMFTASLSSDGKALTVKPLRENSSSSVVSGTVELVFNTGTEVCESHYVQLTQNINSANCKEDSFSSLGFGTIITSADTGWHEVATVTHGCGCVDAKPTCDWVEVTANTEGGKTVIMARAKSINDSNTRRACMIDVSISTDCVKSEKKWSYAFDQTGNIDCSRATCAEVQRESYANQYEGTIPYSGQSNVLIASYVQCGTIAKVAASPSYGGKALEVWYEGNNIYGNFPCLGGMTRGTVDFSIEVFVDLESEQGCQLPTLKVTQSTSSVVCASDCMDEANCKVYTQEVGSSDNSWKLIGIVTHKSDCGCVTAELINTIETENYSDAGNPDSYVQLQIKDEASTLKNVSVKGVYARSKINNIDSYQFITYIKIHFSDSCNNSYNKTWDTDFTILENAPCDEFNCGDIGSITGSFSNVLHSSNAENGVQIGRLSHSQGCINITDITATTDDGATLSNLSYTYSNGVYAFFADFPDTNCGHSKTSLSYTVTVKFTIGSQSEVCTKTFVVKQTAGTTSCDCGTATCGDIMLITLNSDIPETGGTKCVADYTLECGEVWSVTVVESHGAKATVESYENGQICINFPDLSAPGHPVSPYSYKVTIFYDTTNQSGCSEEFTITQLANTASTCNCDSINWVGETAYTWTYTEINAKTFNPQFNCSSIEIDSNGLSHFTVTQSTHPGGTTIVMVPPSKNNSETDIVETVKLIFNGSCERTVTMTHKGHICTSDDFDNSIEDGKTYEYDCNDTNEHLVATVGHECGKVSGATSSTGWSEVRVANETSTITNIYWKAKSPNGNSEVRRAEVFIYTATTSGSYSQWKTINVHQKVCEPTCKCTDVNWPTDTSLTWNASDGTDVTKTIDVMHSCGTVSVNSPNGFTASVSTITGGSRITVAPSGKNTGSSDKSATLTLTFNNGTENCSDTKSLTLTQSKPSCDITITASPSSLTCTGGTVTFTITDNSK